MLHPILQGQLLAAGVSRGSMPTQRSLDALLADVSAAYADAELQLRAARNDTERARHEACALQNTLECRKGRHDQLSAVVAGAPIAMAMFDRDMRYLAWSRKWLADYRLGEIDLTGRSHYEIFPEIPERWKEIHRRCLSGERISQPEDFFERPHDAGVWLRWAVHPWFAPDDSVAGVIMVTDRIDDLVLARDAALQAARTRSEFLSNMTHELSTPLNGVLAPLDLLLDLDPTAEQREWLGMIRTSGLRLQQLIGDLLELARIESGSSSRVAESYDPHALVRQVVASASAEAAAAGLEFTSRLAEDVPTAARGDSARILRMLHHLLDNAVKFTSHGGVSLEVSMVLGPGSLEPGTPHGEPQLQFEVRDTGCGMPADLANRPFRAFAQGDASCSRRYGGAGVGLALCHHLAESMGGTLVLQSEVGRGTTARVAIGLGLHAPTPGACGSAADAATGIAPCIAPHPA